ncbi:MAG: right-handed parallel beta-helix repeat-containing protein, partial [Anaerolineae bacterium]|nr:right-handed parallel beta-helix repeat-containing protein [Anaerolineae bacterium]
MKHRNWINGIIVCILLVSAGLTTLPTKSAARVTPVGSEPGAPAGTVHYVKPGASGSCASWTAACELQNALGKATTGDEIWVAEGTYTPGTYRGDTFQLVEGVGVYGGFAGTETVRSQRDWTAHSCVLSGEIGSGDVITDNVEHVVNGSGVTAAAVLDGFTITGAYAVYDCSPDFDPFCYPEYYGGGGMRIRDGSPVVANLTFVDNEATWGGGLYNGGNATSWMTHMSFVNNRATSAGGGMYNQEANPALTHVTFHANSAPYAAGMYNLQGNPTLTHVTFTGNTAGSGPSGYAGAGGMGNFAGNPILHDVTFAGNTASGSVSGAGGGMSNDSFTLVDIYPTLIDVTFSDNVATTRGGGMSNGDYSHPKLTNVIFEGNTATDGGAIMNDYASSPTLTNVRFVGNSATGKGGGIYNNNECHPTLTNVVFSGNTAFDGGGMNTYYTYGGNVTLANVTFHGNSATNAGGAMYNGGPQAIAIVTNSVLWGNTAPVGAQIHNAWPAGAANVTYSDIQGGWSGTGNIDVDPQFVDPDGPDGVLGTLDDSLRLTLTPVSAAASPIDAGTNAAVPAGVSTDLDGNPRIWPTAGNVDMGAYEVPYVARGVSPPPHILRVKPDGGAGSCADWDHACALQHALNWAPALNGEVWIAGGVYTPTFRTDSGDPRSATFPLLSGTPLYSGFAGDETARDQRDPGANVTVLSGDLGGDDDTDGDGVVLTAAGIRGSNAYHVVSGYDDLTAIDVLEAFVITGGQATGATPDDRGGGVYNAGGSPTLVNLRLSGNTAGQTGGGFYNDGGDPLLANLTFHGNSAGTSGSAIGSDADGLTLANSILWGNAPVQTPIAGSAALTLTHTLVQGGCPAGASCDAIIDDDPQFVSAAAGDLTLACASPALDAGDNDAVPAGVTADLAGNPRFSGIYGAPQVDMGAYEEQYYGDQVTLGHDKLQTGSAYRTGFHQGPGDTIQVTLDAYDPTPLIAADQHFANALTCVGRTAERREHALRGRLDTRWELATGGLLLGNDAMVRALDMRLLPTCPGSQPSLGCQLARLEVARGHLVAATDSYLELLSGDLYTTILALQPTRSSPLADGPATYADIVRLAEAASRESRAYLELAERQFRQYTLAGKSEADATLREGFDRATAGLALLDRLTEGWSGATNDAAYQAAYQALTQNIADMQRMFTYLAHDKNPLGYEAGYVPFYLHFDEAHGGVPLEESNFVAAHDIAQATYSQADQKLEALLGTQRDLDDNETALGEALAELDAEYRAELIELCGADGIEPDLAYCHQNEAGTMYDQLLALQSAHLRVDKVYQEMENQLALIRIEQARAARVAG